MFCIVGCCPHVVDVTIVQEGSSGDRTQLNSNTFSLICSLQQRNRIMMKSWANCKNLCWSLESLFYRAPDNTCTVAYLVIHQSIGLTLNRVLSHAHIPYLVFMSSTVSTLSLLLRNIFRTRLKAFYIYI